MPNALIFSQGFDGHRQVYAFVLADILKDLGFKIYVAGNIKQKISNSFYLDKLKNNPEIQIIDTSKYEKGGIDITPVEFCELQDECKTDLTIFAEADHHISLFVSQIFEKKNKLRGKIIGIFLRPFYYYEHLGLRKTLGYLKYLTLNWRNDNRLFHEFLLKRFSLLDVALTIDENFVSHHKYYQWLPDVFQQYADLIVQDDKSDQRGWIEKLDNFKEKNRNKFFIFYFGTAQSRRGYDILLKIAENNGDCFIHCGLRNSQDQYIFDIDHIRSSLNKNGLLFETNEYIADPVCIEYFFKSVSHLVLPYRDFFGSSGVMLQALGYGIPVLVPENGLMGYRVTKHKLGLTYNGDNSSLIEQYKKFKEMPKQTFAETIALYMNYQSASHLKEALDNAVGA